jgi:acyl-CoA dehydrogenase
MSELPAPDGYQDLRDAVRALCRGFDAAYWRKLDAEQAYPEAFVDALTRAGWLSAMKKRYLPEIASGKLWLQSMAVTESSTGTDTTRLKTTAISTNLILSYIAEHVLGLPRSF